MMGVGDLWQWLKDHDAPNWFAIGFSLVIWPLVLYYWSRRTIQEIPHFEVYPIPGQQTNIGGHTYDAVGFTFTNRTSCVVYVRQVRLRENQKNFPIPSAAVRSLSGWREIKFQDQNGHLIDDERVLNTTGRALSSIAVSKPFGNEILSHRPGWLRSLFRRPKYFTLEYTAMVAERKYSVRTVY
jgi:hypothetical protein